MGKKYEYVNGEKTINGFEIDGSAFSGTLKGNLATTSYFTPDFLKRSVWISTQNGRPLEVKCTKIGEAKLDTPKGKITDFLPNELRFSLIFLNSSQKRMKNHMR